ncbi:MAG: class I SAM-dependent methyltransferase, partial [Dermatophilaceae bacterium]
TGTQERLVAEWLNNQVVGGYVNQADGHFLLPLEHALVLAQESSPALMQGLFDLVAAAYQSIDKETEVFRTGRGLAWGDHDPRLFAATERSFRPGYQAHLIQQWIPAVPGLHEKLTAGARVADVGCGYGTSTVVLATAYPNSTFVGYDYHAPSIGAARAAAERAEVSGRTEFIVADAAEISGPFDLIAFFGCWTDTADPFGVTRAARTALAQDGVVLAVESQAGDRLEDNMGPLGRFGYAISTLACVPCSISDGGPGLGAMAGENRTRALFEEAGFTRFRRAVETPLNISYEARP